MIMSHKGKVFEYCFTARTGKDAFGGSCGDGGGERASDLLDGHHAA